MTTRYDSWDRLAYTCNSFQVVFAQESLEYMMLIPQKGRGPERNGEDFQMRDRGLANPGSALQRGA